VKVLLVSHRFPPEGNAGTESYTASLARGLLRRGHEVRVFAASKDIGAPDLSTRRREHEGIEVEEVVNNLFHQDFRETWDHPGIDLVFEAFLERERPDLVHVQHLLYLSAGCVEAAKRRGIPVVFTLHDFWLQCPRFGQRLHPDGIVCDRIDFGRCGTCLPSFKWAQTSAQRRVGAAIAGVRSATGIDLGPLARRTAGALSRGSAPPFAPPDPADVEAMANAAGARARELHARIVPAVDLFLAPSRFLRDRMTAEWGIPPSRIEHLRFGMDLDAFRAHPRTSSTVLRVAFLGSMIAAKGPHVLLEAWKRIPPELRARGSLVLRGPAHHEPEYVARVEALAAEAGARIDGPLERAEIPRALASIDLLVVPSVWFENAPLVIAEAFAAGTPLLVSDLGGMSELVEEGRGGWRFRAGDAADLAAKLGAILADPARLRELAPPRDPPPTFDAHVDAVLARYRKLG
jgi:glycosyltransferase involved in cell wall biosynthesis